MPSKRRHMYGFDSRCVNRLAATSRGSPAQTHWL